MIRRPPGSTRTDTLCPYTTLFRSIDLGVRSKAFSMTDRTVAPHDGDQLMMRVETQTACAREGRFDLAWDIEKVLLLQRSGAAAGRNLLHVALTTFRAWEAAAFEKVSSATRMSSSADRKSTRLNSSHYC